jgi:hypothetical protein
MNRHHRIEQKREVNSFRFTGELECGGIPVEGPGAFRRSQRDRGFVGRAEESLFEAPFGQFVEDLHRVVGNDVYGDNRAD